MSYDYQVQIRNQKTGLWHVHATVKEEYEYEPAEWKFLWWKFKYEKLVKTKLSSQEERRVKAREIADNFFKEHKDVRIVKVWYNIEEHCYCHVNVIWMNGRWSD